MVGLVQKRIAAFEAMNQMEAVEVRETPVVPKFVDNLISLFEHELPTEIREAAYNARMAEPIDGAFRSPTRLSESSSYWTARSQFEDNNSRNEDPPNDVRNRGSRENVPKNDEDEETRLRKSRFIFHINAPATDIGAARAMAQRRRRVPRAKFYLVKGMRILKKATERRPASFPRQDSQYSPQHSRIKKSSAKNGESVRITRTDPSTSVVTQPRSDNGDGTRRDLGNEVEDGRTSISLLSRLWANLRGGSALREGTQRS